MADLNRKDLYIQMLAELLYLEAQLAIITDEQIKEDDIDN